MEVTFDFGSERHLAELTLHSSIVQGGAPVSARFSVSRDGVNYTSAAGSDLPLRWQAGENGNVAATLDISGWPPARYCRLSLRSAGQWMFLSEINFSEMLEVDLSKHLNADEYLPRVSGKSPLALISRQPANGAEGIQAGTPLKLVFNRPISLGTGRVILRNLTEGTDEEVAVGSPRLIVKGAELTILPPAGLQDGAITSGHPSGWSGALPVARMNPAGDGTFYHGEGFSDRRQSRGMIGAMRGSSMATFTAAFPGAGIRREIGEIEANRRYNVSLAIGCRPSDGPDFLGYSVRLKSGETVLAVLSGDQPPGPPDTVGSVAFGWDSSELPEGVGPGDPLSLEIAPVSRFGHGYLDIDNVQVSISEG